MVYKGKGNLIIGKNPYESVKVTISDMELEEILLELSPMEKRCSICHGDLTKEVDTLFISPIEISEPPLQQLGLSTKIFLVHKKCLEEFTSNYLNLPEKTPKITE